MLGGLTSQALVRIVGDESGGVASLKRFNTHAEASSRQFRRDFGTVAQTAQRVALASGIALAGISYSMNRLNQTYDAFIASNRTLGSAAKLTGTSLATLSGFAEDARKSFQLAVPQANDLTVSVSKLAAKAGDITRTGAAISAFVNLGAAQGLSVDQTLTAVQQAILGIDEGTDKLFQKNPSVLYAEFAAQIGTTAGKLTDAQKAQALMNAALDAAGKVGNAYGAFLETAAGKQQILNNRLNDAAIALATAWQPARVTILEALADGVTDLASTIGQNEDGIRDFFNFLASFSMEGAQTLMEGPANWRGAHGAGSATREWIGQRATSAAFAVDRLTHGDEQAARNLSILRNGRGVAPNGTDLSALGLRNSRGIGLSGRNDDAFRSIFPSSAPVPFPESPANRAAREAREARAAAAAEIFGKSDRGLPTLATPSASGITPLTAESAREMVNKQWEAVAEIFGQSSRDAIARIRPLDLPAWVGGRPGEFGAPRPGETPDAGGRISGNQWLGFAGSVANAGVGVAQGGSSIGGLGSVAGAAAGLFTGGTSTALGAASIGLGVLSSIFGNSRSREEEMYRAQLRALKDSREPQTIVNLRFPAGVIDPRNPDWKLTVADTLREIGGTGTGGLQLNLEDE